LEETKPTKEDTLSKSERKKRDSENTRKGAPPLYALGKGFKYLKKRNKKLAIEGAALGFRGVAALSRKTGQAVTKGKRNFNTWLEIKAEAKAEAKRLKAARRALEPRTSKPSLFRRLYNKTVKKGQVVPLDNASRSNSSAASRVSLPSPRSGIEALAHAHGVVEPEAAPTSLFAKLTAKIRNLRTGPVRVPGGIRGPPLLGRRSSRSSASSRAVSAQRSSLSLVGGPKRPYTNIRSVEPEPVNQNPLPQYVIHRPWGNQIPQAVIPRVSGSSGSKASNSASQQPGPGWVANFSQPAPYIPPNLGPYLVMPPGLEAPVDIGPPPPRKKSNALQSVDDEVNKIYENLLAQRAANRVAAAASAPAAADSSSSSSKKGRSLGRGRVSAPAAIETFNEELPPGWEEYTDPTDENRKFYGKKADDLGIYYRPRILPVKVSNEMTSLESSPHKASTSKKNLTKSSRASARSLSKSGRSSGRGRASAAIAASIQDMPNAIEV
jgi:hypothetical protein